MGACPQLWELRAAEVPLDTWKKVAAQGVVNAATHEQERVGRGDERSPLRVHRRNVADDIPSKRPECLAQSLNVLCMAVNECELEGRHYLKNKGIFSFKHSGPLL